MRGRRLHNAIVNELAWTCRAHGAWARTEAYLGPRVGWADIVAGNGTRLLLIEVELTPARVGSDLAKAIALGANALIVATPNRRVRTACSAALDSHEAAVSGPWLEVRVLTVGAAHVAIERYFGVVGAPYSPTAINQINAINPSMPFAGDGEVSS